MKAIDVNPRLIGHRLRVTTDNLHAEGMLTDLDVMTESIKEGSPLRASMFGSTITAYLTGVILTLDGHELRLRGDEEVAIIGRKQ